MGRVENEGSGVLRVSDSEVSIDEDADSSEKDHISLFSMLGSRSGAWRGNRC